MTATERELLRRLVDAASRRRLTEQLRCRDFASARHRLEKLESELEDQWWTRRRVVA